MKETVACLDRIFSYQVMGSVTVVAGRRGTVTGFQPCIMLGAHTVTIGAGRGIVEHVGVPLCVAKAAPSHTKEDTDHERQEYGATTLHWDSKPAKTDVSR